MNAKVDFNHLALISREEGTALLDRIAKRVPNEEIGNALIALIAVTLLKNIGFSPHDKRLPALWRLAP